MNKSAHIDTFTRDNLPPLEWQPEYLFDRPELQFPPTLNCATELLDRHVAEGRGDRPCLRAPDGTSWSYADLQQQANRIAHVLVDQMGLVPGNRVLLFAPNTPMMVACWFAVMKAGGVAVAVMPLLRAKEIGSILTIARITHALCDERLADELEEACEAHDEEVRRCHFGGSSARPVVSSSGDGRQGEQPSLHQLMQSASDAFDNVQTASDDVCLLGFTSGTTGIPKATMHFHRDVMAICRCWPTHVLKAQEDDIFMGTPPLGFTFGLGGLVLFPMSIGASTVLLERASPEQLLEAIREHGATVLFTAPTSYRSMADLLASRENAGDIRAELPLRKCVSAGEALSAATRALWKARTGIELIDGIGATEMLHIFISADEAHARPGATGKVVPGYVARVQDDAGNELPPNTVGKLAVKGPTGCRYLNDARQRDYVRNGWNVTGDAYLMDEDGYFFYQARTDDMIISAGYNIAAPEVENVLMTHPVVTECAVVGVPDEARGQIVKAFIVLASQASPSDELVRELQRFVKQSVAPYKYPRAIEFVQSLPRTSTGKLQRHVLKKLSSDR
ncbi:MAG: AMP-binding protein [Lautropia sp.]|nr:AMP-binding protein [Lautropia sp.]